MKVIPGEGQKKILKIKQKKYGENLGGMDKAANTIIPWTDGRGSGCIYAEYT